MDPSRHLEIDLFGSFGVRRDGRPVPRTEFGGRLAQRLVRCLAVRRGEVVGRDRLIEWLWAGDPPADPHANLNVVVNRARKALGAGAYLDTAPGGYRLASGPGVAVDIEHFDELVQSARRAMGSGEWDRALTSASSGLSMWGGGPLMEDAYDDWAIPTRDRLLRLKQEALEMAATAALELGDPGRAEELAAEAVREQPLREPAHILVMKARAAAGDPAGAISAYDDLRTSLVEELGIDPSPVAETLYESLLRGDTGTHQESRATPTVPLPLPFVGRRDVIRRIGSLSVDRPIALVRGAPGSGKSRLLEEVLAATNEPHLFGRALLPERDTPWSLARRLLGPIAQSGVSARNGLSGHARAAIEEILTGVGGPGSRPKTDARTRRLLAVEAVLSLLDEMDVRFVVADDIQWADASSLHLLSVLATATDGIRMVFAHRTQQGTSGEELATFLRGVRTAVHTCQIDLTSLDIADVEVLAGDRTVAELIVDGTDATPFAVLEILRAMEDRGVLRRIGTGWEPNAAGVVDAARQEIQAGLQRSIEDRYERQSVGAREMLGLLALVGRPVPPSLLAAATGRSEPDTNATLRELSAVGLARVDSSGWALDHDLVSDAVDTRIDPPERSRLHQLLARVLDGPDSSAERARHLAGAGDRPGAVSEYVRAAKHHLDRFADREALGLLMAGLDLDPADTVRAALLELRAEVRFRSGDLDAARSDLRQSLRLVEAPDERSRRLSRLAGIASGAEDLMRADRLVELALAEAKTDPRSKARALAVGAIIDMNLEYSERADARSVEALALFEELGDARGMAEVADGRAMASFLGGHLPDALVKFDRVANLFEDIGDLVRVVTPRSTRGHGLVFTGHVAEALEETGSALELARSLRSVEGEAYALWHRSEALTAAGRLDDAMAAADTALSIAQRIGHRGWTATAWRAIGIARRACGDTTAAEEAYRSSLACTDHLPLFACWAHAQLALLLIENGRLQEAWPHVERAIGTGPPLGRFEARLARCEFAHATDDPNTPSIARHALDDAVAVGYVVGTERLAELSDRRKPR